MKTSILRHSKLLLLPFYLAACPAAELPTRIFYDDTFDSGWVSSNAGSYAQIASGQIVSSEQGYGYRSTALVGYTFQSRVNYRAQHIWTEASYDPLIDGPIKTIEWDVHFRTWQGAHVLNLLLQQNGSSYSSSGGEIAFSEFPHWQSHHVFVHPSTFHRVSGDGPEQLDYSSCGNPIQFGYVNYNETGIPVPAGLDRPYGEFHVARYGVTVAPDQQFRVTSIQRNSDGSYTLQWQSMLGIFLVEFSEDPANKDSWRPMIETIHISTSCTESATFTTDIPKGFFRIQRF